MTMMTMTRYLLLLLFIYIIYITVVDKQAAEEFAASVVPKLSLFVPHNWDGLQSSLSIKLLDD